jgi:hypothetical protein
MVKAILADKAGIVRCLRSEVVPRTVFVLSYLLGTILFIRMILFNKR